MFESTPTEVEEIISFSGLDRAEMVLHESTQDHLAKFIKSGKWAGPKSIKDNLYGMIWMY